MDRHAAIAQLLAGVRGLRPDEVVLGVVAGRLAVPAGVGGEVDDGDGDVSAGAVGAVA